MTMDEAEVWHLLQTLAAHDEREATPPTPARRVHYTQLPAAKPGADEWACYLRNVAGWLASGHEGKWALIRGHEIIGLFPTCGEARAEAHRRCPGGPAWAHQINEWEPVYNSLSVRTCRP